jgi:uncharacterized membrane-anchored protein
LPPFKLARVSLRARYTSSCPMDATQMQKALMVAAPEEMIPVTILKDHASVVLMMPLVVFSIIFIIVGIIAFSAASNKTPGTMFLVLGLLLGGGALFVMIRGESKKTT